MTTPPTPSARIAPAIRQWADYLDGGNLPGPAALAGLAGAMNECLHVRNAILISGFAPRNQWDGPFLLRMIDRPRATRTAVQRLLDSMWHTSPDPVQAGRAQAGLAAMASAAPGARVQPLAVGAYLYWQAGDPRALDALRETLAIDPDNDIARVIALALHYQPVPAA